jgi:hypothetical protein
MGFDVYSPCIGNYGSETCGELPPDFECVPGASGPGVWDGDIALQSLHLQLADLGGLACVTGDLDLSFLNDDNLLPLSNLTAVGGSLTLSQSNLETLDGVENLTTIGSALIVSDNPYLSSFAGLSALTSLGVENPDGSPPLYVFDNPWLAACWPELLETQTGQQCGYLAAGDPFVDCSGNDGSGNCN